MNLMFNIYIILFLILKIRLKLYKCIVMDILGFLIILCVFEKKILKLFYFVFLLKSIVENMFLRWLFKYFIMF